MQLFIQAATAYVRSIYPEFSTFQANWALVATWSYFILWFTGNQFGEFRTLGAGHYLSAGVGWGGAGQLFGKPVISSATSLPNFYLEVDPPTTDGL